MNIREIINESDELIGGRYSPEEFDELVKSVGQRAAKNPVDTKELASRLWNKKAQPSGFDGEYDDEAGMAKTNLITMARAVADLLKTIDDRENLPEWVQEKIAVAEEMLVTVWDYLKSQEVQGVDPRVGD